MDIIVSQEQGRVPITVIHPKGNLDAASYEQFQAEAEKAVQGGAHNILVDLSDVPYMSSAGMRTLNYLFNSLRTDAPAESRARMDKDIPAGKFKSPHLKLLNPTRRVLDALKMAGFDLFLDIQHNRKDAIASF
jgi:hypothetical protein